MEASGCILSDSLVLLEHEMTGCSRKRRRKYRTQSKWIQEVKEGSRKKKKLTEQETSHHGRNWPRFDGLPDKIF